MPILTSHCPESAPRSATHPKSAGLPSSIFLQCLLSCNCSEDDWWFGLAFLLESQCFFPSQLIIQVKKNPRTCTSAADHRGKENSIFQEGLGQGSGWAGWTGRRRNGAAPGWLCSPSLPPHRLSVQRHAHTV